MAVLLRDLYAQVQHMDMKLVAGEGGMDNIVSWTHMVDSDKIVEFLEGGEIAFTTGLGLNEEFYLLDLVKGVYKNGASAIVINLGPYIEKIEEEVLEFANEADFPVFEVPWQVHMPEIIRIFCFYITKTEQKNIELKAAVSNAIFCPKQEELYVGTLMQKGFLPEWNYCVTLLDVMQEKRKVSEQRLEKIFMGLEKHILHSYKNIILFTHENQIILLLCHYDRENIDKILNQIFEDCTQVLHEKENCYISAGKMTKSVRCIYKSYIQAVQIAKMQQTGEMTASTQKGNSSLLEYKDLGIYKLLISIEDKEVMEDYVRETVLPLYEYDKMNQGDLVQVMKCYIKHSGSVKETAEELFVHRNTINYKIKKAEEILGESLSGLDVRVRLNIGFMIYGIQNSR